MIARTSQSARNAREAGARWVCDAADIIFVEPPLPRIHRPGIAVALRLPNKGATQEYMETLRDIHRRLQTLQTQVDFVRVEEPLGREMTLSGIGTYLERHTSLAYDDTMYLPFLFQRDAVMSSRLHTTLISLLSGTRKIQQFHIELGTNKAEEILDDMGLHSLNVYRIADVNWANIERFLSDGVTLPEDEVQTALRVARAKVTAGMDAFVEWLESI